MGQGPEQEAYVELTGVTGNRGVGRVYQAVDLFSTGCPSDILLWMLRIGPSLG